MEFKLKNPNIALIKYGFIVMAISLAVILLAEYKLAVVDPTGFILGLGLLVRILVLLWVPKASLLAGRNSVTWTIFCFLEPTIGLIILGSSGIKYSPAMVELEEKYKSKFNGNKKELNTQLAANKIEEDEFYSQLSDILSDLQNEAYEEMPGVVKAEDNAFLTEQLKKQGYVIEEDSDVFVDVAGKCPACGAKVNEHEGSCPDCGLKL